MHTYRRRSNCKTEVDGWSTLQKSTRSRENDRWRCVCTAITPICRGLITMSATERCVRNDKFAFFFWLSFLANTRVRILGIARTKTTTRAWKRREARTRFWAALKAGSRWKTLIYARSAQISRSSAIRGSFEKASSPPSVALCTYNGLLFVAWRARVLHARSAVSSPSNVNDSRASIQLLGRSISLSRCHLGRRSKVDLDIFIFEPDARNNDFCVSHLVIFIAAVAAKTSKIKAAFYFSGLAFGLDSRIANSNNIIAMVGKVENFSFRA